LGVLPPRSPCGHRETPPRAAPCTGQGPAADGEGACAGKAVADAAFDAAMEDSPLVWAPPAMVAKMVGFLVDGEEQMAMHPFPATTKPAPAAARGVGRAHGGSRPPGTSSTGFKYREEGTSSSTHPGRQEALDRRRPPQADGAGSASGAIKDPHTGPHTVPAATWPYNFLESSKCSSPRFPPISSFPLDATAVKCK